MRESFGGALMLKIFLVVIVLFIVFLCISANFARAFRVKNGVIDIIEQYQGVNSNSIPIIEDYIQRMGYSCGGNNIKEVTHYVLRDSGVGNNYQYGNYDGKNRYQRNLSGINATIPDKRFNVRVCIDWHFPIFNLNGTWEFGGQTEIIKNAVHGVVR